MNKSAYFFVKNDNGTIEYYNRWGFRAVSYTHLDVYKRQQLHTTIALEFIRINNLIVGISFWKKHLEIDFKINYKSSSKTPKCAVDFSVRKNASAYLSKFNFHQLRRLQFA